MYVYSAQHSKEVSPRYIVQHRVLKERVVSLSLRLTRYLTHSSSSCVPQQDTRYQVARVLFIWRVLFARGLSLRAYVSWMLVGLLADMSILGLF